MAWNVLLTTPAHEAAAAARLSSLSLVVFLPMTTATVRQGRSRARHTITQPFFRGYLFAQSGDGLWNHIHEVSSVRGFLRRADGSPAVLSDQAVTAVKEMAAMQNATPAKAWPFQPGDRVRVRDRADPFHGVIGILQHLDRKDRAVLESMTNFRTKLTVDAARLELAE